MGTVTKSLSETVAQWHEARRIYPFYAALARQFRLEMRACPELEHAAEIPKTDSLEVANRWFADMDTRIEVHQMRERLQTTYSCDEPLLRALLRHHLEKKKKAESDRDKTDFLMVQYLAQCIPPAVAQRDLDLTRVAEVLQPVVGSTATPPENEALEGCLNELNNCDSLRDLVERGILDQSRMLKSAEGKEYFKPSVLVAFARFNFLLRRGFIRLLNADLHAIDSSLRKLEASGVVELDCTHASLSAAESVRDLQRLRHQWERPFSGKYTDFLWMAQIIDLRWILQTELEKLQKAPQSEETRVEAEETKVEAADTRLEAAVASAANAAPAEVKAEAPAAEAAVTAEVAAPVVAEVAAAEEKAAPAAFEDFAAMEAAAPVAEVAASEPVPMPVAIAPQPETATTDEASDSTPALSVEDFKVAIAPAPVEDVNEAASVAPAASAAEETDPMALWQNAMADAASESTPVGPSVEEVRAAAMAVPEPVATTEAPVSASAPVEETKPAELKLLGSGAAAASPFAGPVAEAAPKTPALDIHTFLAEISQQVAAAPNGKTLVTVALGDTKITLFSWDTTAFRKPDEPTAAVVRRAVAVRAILATALDSGDAERLEAALEMARKESEEMHQRVTAARAQQKIDVASSLSACTKALLTLVEKAER